MQTVRPPAVAGMFYPGQRAELAEMVDDLLGQAQLALEPESPDRVRTAPKALVLPHAGYVYSGSTAALGYALLHRCRATIRRVVLLGPTHRVYVDGLALPGVTAFDTPLGRVRVGSVPDALADRLPQLTTNPRVHAQEHSLEVHLPFLQTALDDVEVLPLAVGRATPDEVAAVIDELWGGPETVVVVSSDLSHYLPYDQAEAADQATVDQLLELESPLLHEQACGATPVNGLLVAAARRRLQARLLGRCNSGDTAGDRRKVVGYAALAYFETS